MSETEAYTGTLVPVNRQGKSLDDWLESLGVILSEDKWERDNEKFEYMYRKFIHDHDSDTTYEVSNLNPLDPDDFLYSNKKEDGSIDFTVSFYNGGVSFDEALQGVFT